MALRGRGRGGRDSRALTDRWRASGSRGGPTACPEAVGRVPEHDDENEGCECHEVGHPASMHPTCDTGWDAVTFRSFQCHSMSVRSAHAAAVRPALGPRGVMPSGSQSRLRRVRGLPRSATHGLRALLELCGRARQGGTTLPARRPRHAVRDPVAPACGAARLQGEAKPTRPSAPCGRSRCAPRTLRRRARSLSGARRWRAVRSRHERAHERGAPRPSPARRGRPSGRRPRRPLPKRARTREREPRPPPGRRRRVRPASSGRRPPRAARRRHLDDGSPSRERRLGPVPGGRHGGRGRGPRKGGGPPPRRAGRRAVEMGPERAVPP
jgi:hypothetical protein